MKFNHRNKIVKQLADQFHSLLTERSELYIASLMRLYREREQEREQGMHTTTDTNNQSNKQKNRQTQTNAQTHAHTHDCACRFPHLLWSDRVIVEMLNFLEAMVCTIRNTTAPVTQSPVLRLSCPPYEHVMPSTLEHRC